MYTKKVTKTEGNQVCSLHNKENGKTYHITLDSITTENDGVTKIVTYTDKEGFSYSSLGYKVV